MKCVKAAVTIAESRIGPKVFNALTKVHQGFLTGVLWIAAHWYVSEHYPNPYERIKQIKYPEPYLFKV